MLRAEITVKSDILSLERISAELGRKPDRGYERNSVGELSRMPKDHSSWSLRIEWPVTAHDGTEGLSIGIESLGLALAERAGRLAKQNCSVVVSVMQEISESSQSKGLHLTPAALDWLVVAGAALDVDQYVIIEP